MANLAVFLAFLVWLGAFGRESIARLADFMATKERKLMNSLKKDDSTTWSTSATWWEDNYGPVKLWGYAGRRYENATQMELDAEIAAELESAVDTDKPIA